MRLFLHRKHFFEKATIGELYLSGMNEPVFFCHTLEDVVRPAGTKVDDQTAIPRGNYQVIIDMSNRFKKMMPHVLDVPGFEGIRIHNGNTDANTDGCVLVGKWDGKATDFIAESRDTFANLFALMVAATDKMTLEIDEV